MPRAGRSFAKLACLFGSAGLFLACQVAPAENAPPKPNLASYQQPGPAPRAHDAQSLAAAGKIIFEANCAECHGKEGNAVMNNLPNIPSFADPAWQTAHTDAEITATLKNGQGAMPRYDGPESDIPALVAYVRTMAKR
jgi:mono/diheme cytochrome c family protein